MSVTGIGSTSVGRIAIDANGEPESVRPCVMSQSPASRIQCLQDNEVESVCLPNRKEPGWTIGSA